jgi:hypothetical protein
MTEKTYRYHHKKWDINAINSTDRNSIRKGIMDFSHLKTNGFIWKSGNDT